jgi:murein L,D-transpeptidase YafK
LIRARLYRALTALAVTAAALTLVGCYGEETYELPTHAMKELSPQTLALLEQKNMAKDSPVLIRLFKEEAELEVWKQDRTNRYQLLKVYPICRWSGDLGPKVREGDRQAPEGFYQITPDLMNPSSNYYLAINTGFPNAYDRANGRTGGLLMIHGDCSSRGCYAMTDEQIGEIYSLAREAFLGGQQSFQIQAYPFRMTPLNMARHRTNPNMPFWRMLKQGNDHFEVTHLEPKVEVCERRYVFDAQPPPNSNKPLVFNPTGRCPAYVVPPAIATLVQQKEHDDDLKYTQLAKSVNTAPIRTGLDGGMNRVFLSQVGGSLPPARVESPLPPQSASVVAVDGGAQPTLANRLLGGLFGSGPAEAKAGDAGAPVRSADATGAAAISTHRHTPKAESAEARSEARMEHKKQPKAISQQIAVSGPKPGEPQKPAQQELAAKPQRPAQQQANASSAAAGSAMNGAQPTGTFESRWSGLQ